MTPSQYKVVKLLRKLKGHEKIGIFSTNDRGKNGFTLDKT